mmetsp:Transcript_23727/g.50307  ORF Transcript_23727/g.50307 Transcript_23727/m.50307 type:complete len:306 (+) Transcript_23727:42-959(+)
MSRDVSARYSKLLQADPASSSAAAIKALTEIVSSSSSTTIMGLRDDLIHAGQALGQRHDAPISIASLCELFVRFVTRTALETRDFEACRRLIGERGEQFALSVREAPRKIAKLGAPFVNEGGAVMTLGYSRIVTALLLEAAATKHFSVIVAESHPHGDGHRTARELLAAGVPVTMVEDAAVAYVIARCQMTLVGAEAVAESGGIINKAGTLQMAIVAHVCKRPFYVASESTKFARMFPLSQLDVPKTEQVRTHAAFVGQDPPPPQLVVEAPSRDYTPPCYITMLFTDLGVLTPSAVSDELIKLFD